MFVARPVGTTSRRLQDALHRPHSALERFDPEFPVAMRCKDCGKVGYGPRKHMKEAIDEHRQRCPARVSHNDEQPFVTQILYPRT